MTDEISWPRNHTLGYLASYPLMLVTLGSLALALLVCGLLLGAIETFVERSRVSYVPYIRSVFRSPIVEKGG